MPKQDDAENAVDLVREFMKVLIEAREAANRSVLDGTVSCTVCRALMLEQNGKAHYRWHYEGHHADLKEARLMISL